MAVGETRAFCLKRGGLPPGTIAANGGTTLGVQVDRNTDPTPALSTDTVNKWWMGPIELPGPTCRLFIAHPVGDVLSPGSNEQPVPGGVTTPPTPDANFAGVGFWGSSNANDFNDSSAYIAIGNNAWKVVNGTPGAFTTDTQVRNWVKTQGYWDNYDGGIINTTNPQTPAPQP